MNIIHRLVFNAREHQLETKTLDELKIPYRYTALPAPEGVQDAVGLVTFEIAESDPQWKSLEVLCRDWDCLDHVNTKFSSREFNQAAFVALDSCWLHGYPMPDDDAGYLALTYSGKCGCIECGVGLVQSAPFRIKGEPKWNKKSLMQLNWVFDELFVTRQAYENVFQPFGISCCEVLNFKTGSPLTTVVQLAVDAIAEFPLEIGKAVDEVCSKCGCGKYHPHTRGFFPKLQGAESEHIFKTQEFFGSGGSAWKAIIFSHELYDALRRFALKKGSSFYPLAT